MSETTMRLLQPEGWATPKGYVNGIAARGTLVFVSGQMGWNAHQQFETDNFVGQARQALANVVAVLREAARVRRTSRG
jgi:enamine deaminase RidA (YjgF/YER057c/UK114 family)